MNDIFNEQDLLYMTHAIEEAKKAKTRGEVPVGAVITLDNKPIARAGNSPISSRDPTAHAEINAIRKAAMITGNYRLPEAAIYITLEPCIMCMGAIIHARIKRVVFGASDPKTGAAVSQYQLGRDSLLNHELIIQGGLLEEQCGSILKTFFRERRQKGSDNRSTSIFCR